MSGKLIIQGKAWGEFESARRSKGNIEISGYRSYGGTHTVRMVEQPQLNENQQVVLDWLKANVDQDDASPMCSIFLLGSLWESRKFNIQEDIAIDNAYSELSYKQQAQVLEVFSRWALEQEEE